MSGYAASARIERVHVRRAVAEPDRGRGPSPAPWDDGPTELVPHDAGDVERVVSDLRVAWAQTTFYLFHPESWRR
jgi:hypothetical protein